MLGERESERKRLGERGRMDARVDGRFIDR